MEDKKKKDEIAGVLSTAAEIGADVAGLWFPVIPIVASVISGVKGLVDQRHLNERLTHIEESISKMEEELYHNSIEQAAIYINNKIKTLNTHDFYAVKRDLRFLIADAQPEVVDTFVSSLLHFLHDEDHSMDEEVMDILIQFNAHDIALMEKVEQYRNQQYKIEDAKEENEKPDGKTITVIMGFKWDEFADFLGYKGKKLRDALTGGAYKQGDGKYSFNFAYMGRSLLILQSLGVFDLAFKMYVGSSSVTDIYFVTITQFGNEILKHIAFANGWPQRYDPNSILVSH